MSNFEKNLRYQHTSLFDNDSEKIIITINSITRSRKNTR